MKDRERVEGSERIMIIKRVELIESLESLESLERIERIERCQRREGREKKSGERKRVRETIKKEGKRDDKERKRLSGREIEIER